MNIVLVTNHFSPEEFRCNDLVFELARRGHRVSVLTGIPDYPKGRFYKGYGYFRKRIEKLNGVRVFRSFIIPRGNGGVFRLALNYCSSLLAQCWDAIWLGLLGDFDYVLVHETSPVMVGLPGIIISKIKQIPMDFWVLDLWPESLQDAGGVNNSRILDLFGKLTTWIYKQSNHILISSQGFKESICEKGDFENKIVYFPNWADVTLNDVHNNFTLPLLPEGFRVLFAGNIGEAQDMDNLMKAASLLKDRSDIHFLILGDGRKRLWVEEYVKNHSLEKTVHLLGRYPIEAMPAFFAAADVLLVTLKDSKVFNRTAPAKIQAYMNAGKPIVAMINGEGAVVVSAASCGLSVPAGDYLALASLLNQMSHLDPQELAIMGERGKQYCNEHFSFASTVSVIEKLMNDRR